jgi:isopenicillin N synthase-like dioxygenase
LAPYLSAQPGARERLARQLCHAVENIGFYFIKGHGVPQSLCDAVFAETERFHAQPLDDKLKLRRNRPTTRTCWLISAFVEPICGLMTCRDSEKPSSPIAMRLRRW